MLKKIVNIGKNKNVSLHSTHNSEQIKNLKKVIVRVNMTMKFKKIIIYATYMIIYVNITDRRTDKHIKSIVRNLTNNFFSF